MHPRRPRRPAPGHDAGETTLLRSVLARSGPGGGLLVNHGLRAGAEKELYGEDWTLGRSPARRWTCTHTGFRPT